MDKSQYNILVVDDNDMNQDVMRRMIKAFGYQAEVAADGQQALEKLQAKRYDLVFMDIMMPVMDGYETTQKIRELQKENKLNKPIIIIAVTAKVLASDRAYCMKIGMDDYLEKPVDMNLLKNTISAYLHPAQL